MSKHTPGPWEIGLRNGANSNTIYARNGETEHDDSTVCSVFRMFMYCDMSEQKDPIGIANARLIAAAPNILDELVAARETIQQIQNSMPGPFFQEQIDRIDAAIKKATQ